MAEFMFSNDVAFEFHDPDTARKGIMQSVEPVLESAATDPGVSAPPPPPGGVIFIPILGVDGRPDPRDVPLHDDGIIFIPVGNFDEIA